MKIAHLSDVHLGLRLYGVERNGMNLKESDMLAAFNRTIADIISQQPDIVLIAGDLFDTPSGPRTSIRPCISALKQLLLALPGVQVVAIGGNHDSAKTPGDTAHVLLLVREAVPQIKVRIYQPGSLTLQVGDKRVGIGMLPSHYSASAYAQPVPEPIIHADESADYNILVIHGMYPGLVLPETGREDPTWQVHPSFYVRGEWDYIAWGHYHEFTRLSDNEYYSGSTEHHSFPSEHARPRGYIIAQLDGGLRVEHRPIAGRIHQTFTISTLQELESLPLIPGAFLRLRVKTDSSTSEQYREIVRASRSLFSTCPVVILEPIRPKRTITVDRTGSGEGTVSVEERWLQFCSEMVTELPEGVTLEEVSARGIEALTATSSKEA